MTGFRVAAVLLLPLALAGCAALSRTTGADDDTPRARVALARDPRAAEALVLGLTSSSGCTIRNATNNNDGHICRISRSTEVPRCHVRSAVLRTKIP